MINLLDCTLRDGGYVNNWEFGYNDINIVVNRLINANVNIIEVGFIDGRVESDINRSIQPKIADYNRVLDNVDKKNSLLFAMIDYGTCPIENICNKEDCIIDGIRLIFKKPNMYKAVAYAKELKAKGYLVCLQMVSITSYGEQDVEEFARLANEMQPYAVSIVDTYGLLMEKDVVKYYRWLDEYLDTNITIGYHAHNNFQLGYANVIKVVESKSEERDLIVDGTLFGMGKSAGNAPLELVALYLNNEHNADYNMNQILEAIDCNIMKIFYKKYWGYSYKFFISSAYNCHPNYVNYLVNKNTLSIESISEIIGMIDEEKKLNYSESLIEDLYKRYQSSKIDDKKSYSQLEEVFKNKKILILGLGRSIITEENKIKEFINKNHPVIIALNGLMDNIDFDYLFISNAKRYANIAFKTKELNKCKIIATSNVLDLDNTIDYQLNYDDLAINEVDSSLIILLEFLYRINAQNLYLAGCDGFYNNQDNYYDNSVALASPSVDCVNEKMAECIRSYKKKLNINFITKSLYEEC